MRRSFVRRFLLRRVAQVGAGCALLWTVGCADDVTSTPTPAAATPMTARGEPAESGCAAWRSASCSYFSRCGKAGASCAEQFGAIQCRSETESELCAAQLRNAKCGAAPSECQPGVIANSVSAVAGCHQYVDAACASAAHCGFDSSTADCLAMEPLDCSRAVGIIASFDQCLGDLKSVSCQSWVPPDACKGVVVVH